MKMLRIGRRRSRDEGLPRSPLELALYPALADGRWQVPDRFNFTRDVVEALGDDNKRQAVTVLGKDGIIEPRTFLILAERSARWSSLLRERGVRPGDRVLVLMGMKVDWLEVVLACLKVGAVVVPGQPTMSAEMLDDHLARTGPTLVVAARTAENELGRTQEPPHVLYVDEAQQLLRQVPEHASTHDTSSRDLAFILTTAGTSGEPKFVGHTHGSVFAARVAAEHWLDAGRGDAVWCTAPTGSADAIWHGLIGPWSRGAEALIAEGVFEARERLDLIYRLGVTILCQSPAEYAALAELPELARFQPPRLRRLASTGDYLDPEVSAAFEETWGLAIHDAYGQAETGVVVANGGDAGFKAGSLGLPIPGHQVAVIDENGSELPPGVEGTLAVRGRPPSLFAGYWEAPDETKNAFRGDWYVTSDVATVDDDGFFWFAGRVDDMITSRGERFSPYATERALRQHDAVAACAVVGMRDLERGGQYLRAFVVLAPRIAGSEQLEAELRQHVAQVLAEHEVPREIEFVAELPTTGGKVNRLELRERLVVGQPLWEMPATSQDETSAEAPSWDAVIAGWSTSSAEAAPAELEAEQAADPDVLPDYIIEPEPVPQPRPTTEPIPEPTPAKPAAEAEPRPAEAVPEPTAEAAPDLEPVALPELEPAPDVQPEPEPEPAAEAAPVPEPEPSVERVVEPPAETAPEPDSEPGANHVPEFMVEPVSLPEPEPEPTVAAAPEPAAPWPESDWVESETATEPEPLPEYVVDPQTAPEPVAELPKLPSALEPEPDPGPLPDYIVDPENPPRPVVEPHPQQPPHSPPLPPLPPPDALDGNEPAAVPQPDEPSLANLGLPPLTEFPSFAKDPEPDERPDAESQKQGKKPKPKRPRSAPAAERRARRERSAGEPGDEPEAVDWMDGLSSRLSAYSLADEGVASEPADGEPDPEDKDE